MATLQPGQTVTWTSQAHGSVKTKTGTVVAYVGPAQDAYRFIPPGLGRGRVHFQQYSQVPRYVVAVPRRSGLLDYYAPPARLLEAQEG